MKKNSINIEKWLLKYAPELWHLLNLIWWYGKITLQIDETLLHKESPRKDSRMLFFGIAQSLEPLTKSSVLALSLRLRGYSCYMVGCDRFLKGNCNTGYYPKTYTLQCIKCYMLSKKFRYNIKLPTFWLSQFANKESICAAVSIVDKINPMEYTEFSYKGLSLGNIIRPAVGHFLRKGIIDLSEPYTKMIYKNFLTWSIVMVGVCKEIINKLLPTIIVMCNGLFMAERIMFEVARRSGIRVVVYETGLLPKTLVFHHNKVIDYDLNRYWECLKDKPLTILENEKLDKYIMERYSGKGQVTDYWSFIESKASKITKVLNIDKKKKLAVLFPNIAWDTALYERDICFKNMFEWLKKTIEYFIRNKECQLIIRAHPGEEIIRGAQRDAVVSWINHSYKKLPNNIKILPPTSIISSYVLMELSDFGLVYTSTTGLEMALIGKPIVIVGDVHYRNKGFTIDVNSEDEYYNILDGLIKGEPSARGLLSLELARRYAYLSFFKASLPFLFANYNYNKRWPNLIFPSLRELLYGKEPVLDMICSSIMNEGNFILD